MRPCDTCNGKGHVEVEAISETGQTYQSGEWCPRCGDMPWLSNKHWPGYMTFADDIATHERGRFKPDPESVMRWCFKHNHRAERVPGMGYQIRCWYGTHFDDPNPCRVGWVPAITETDRLEEA